MTHNPLNLTNDMCRALAAIVAAVRPEWHQTAIMNSIFAAQPPDLPTLLSGAAKCALDRTAKTPNAMLFAERGYFAEASLPAAAPDQSSWQQLLAEGRRHGLNEYDLNRLVSDYAIEHQQFPPFQDANICAVLATLKGE